MGATPSIASQDYLSAFARRQLSDAKQGLPSAIPLARRHLKGMRMHTLALDQLYQQIVERTPDAVIAADRDGIIRLWNAGAESVFGHTARDSIGQSLDLIVPERQRERHWAGYRRVMATSVTEYGQNLLSVPAMHKNGSRLSIEFSLTLLKDDEGKLLGAAVILRDVTERWQRERALNESLSALQAKQGDPPTS